MSAVAPASRALFAGPAATLELIDSPEPGTLVSSPEYPGSCLFRACLAVLRTGVDLAFLPRGSEDARASALRMELFACLLRGTPSRGTPPVDGDLSSGYAQYWDGFSPHEESHPEFQSLLSVDNGWRRYLDFIRTPGTWGGPLELLAFSDLTQRPVLILSPSQWGIRLNSHYPLENMAVFWLDNNHYGALRLTDRGLALHRHIGTCPAINELWTAAEDFLPPDPVARTAASAAIGRRGGGR